MRNFFKNPFGRNARIRTKHQIAEMLDTDEDRIINQYKGYLNYINKVKKELLQRSEDFISYRRQLHTRGNKRGFAAFT